MAVRLTIFCFYFLSCSAFSLEHGERVFLGAGKTLLVDDFISSGGYGYIYSGKLRRPGLPTQPVAIKHIRVEDPDTVEGILTAYRTAKAVFSLVDSNVRRFVLESEFIGRFDTSESGKGVPLIVMELGSGSLEGAKEFFLLAGRKTLLGTRLAAIKELIATLSQVSRQMKRFKVGHHDIWPENILVSAEGTPKLADWDLFAHLEDALKEDGVASPLYSAPERFTTGRFHAGSDAFSIGATAYELLMGQPPLLAYGMQRVGSVKFKDAELKAFFASKEGPKNFERFISKSLDDAWKTNRVARHDKAFFELKRIIEKLLAVDPDRRRLMNAQENNETEALKKIFRLSVLKCARD